MTHDADDMRRSCAGAAGSLASQRLSLLLQPASTVSRGQLT